MHFSRACCIGVGLHAEASLLTFSFFTMQYSGIPPYGTQSGHYNNEDTLFGPKCIYICLCTTKTPEMCNLPYFVKWRGSPVLTVPELYKIHSVMQTLVYHFCKIVCHIWWIQRPGITLALLFIVLTSKMQPCCVYQLEYM